ncbi:hypothetical protein PIB30_010057, partial [Stylosanthes scabra]|nr:hypothetical protein [Stylosanthes scabra]
MAGLVAIDFSVRVHHSGSRDVDLGLDEGRKQLKDDTDAMDMAMLGVGKIWLIYIYFTILQRQVIFVMRYLNVGSGSKDVE